jgi:K+-sensing histidine kinase KdpD
VKVEDFEDNLCIIVQDSGAGMSPKMLKTIGKDFVTHNNSENQNEQGIGLGLSLCK